MSYNQYSIVNFVVATIFTGIGGYLVGGTKEDDPNRKILKGFGIFAIVFGILIYCWELIKYAAYRADTRGMNGDEFPNTMYEMPQNAVVEPAVPVANAVEPGPGLNQAPVTVQVNNPGGNLEVGVPNNTTARRGNNGNGNRRN